MNPDKWLDFNHFSLVNIQMCLQKHTNLGLSKHFFLCLVYSMENMTDAGRTITPLEKVIFSVPKYFLPILSPWLAIRFRSTLHFMGWELCKAAQNMACHKNLSPPPKHYLSFIYTHIQFDHHKCSARKCQWVQFICRKELMVFLHFLC